ncbi:MAG: NAD(P)/FAD-dependent oxidoreductase [Candidatus Njordarchaeales archaeon]
MFDVVVVGAGFVGNFIGTELAKKGYNVLILEEHKRVGFPPHCAGLVGITGLERIGLRNKVRENGLIINKIRGARFFSKKKGPIEIYYNEPVAWVIDRVKLDTMLHDEFLSHGGVSRLGVKVRKISPDGKLLTSKGQLNNAHVIVDAEGARRLLIREFPGTHTKGLLPALQIDVRGSEELEDDFVEVHFNVPDFFSWIIPLGDRNYRVGVASKHVNRNMFVFVKKFARKRLGRINVLKTFGGIVVSGPPLKKMVWKKVIAVGDAAGHTKPTTGGGVVFGGLSAKIAAEVIHHYLNSEVRSLHLYERMWKRTIGTHLEIMLRMKQLLQFISVSERLMDFLFSIMPKYLGNNVKSDFDFHSTIILPKIKT